MTYFRLRLLLGKSCMLFMLPEDLLFNTTVVIKFLIFSEVLELLSWMREFRRSFTESINKMLESAEHCLIGVYSSTLL